MLHSRQKPVVAAALGALLVALVSACLPTPGTTGNIAGVIADMYDAQTLILPGWSGTQLPTSQGPSPTTAAGTSTMALTGLGGAVESFQIRVTGGAQALPQTAIKQTATFTATDGSKSTIPDADVRLYREGYYHLTTMSDGELATEFGRDATSGACQPSGTTGTQGANGGCRIPDALIPACTVATRPCPAASTTKAFPVDIPANENRVAWVDVQIPAGQHPGNYEANFEVDSNTVAAWNLNVTLNVKNVGIPATPTMTSQFRVNVNEIGLDWSAFQQISELGLNDRAQVLLEDMNDWQLGKTALKALIEGTDPAVTLADASVPPGAGGAHGRLTTLLVDHNVSGPNLAALRTWLQNLDGHDYSGIVKFYCDEISAADCQTQYTAAVASYPGLPLEAIPNPIDAHPLNTVPAATQTLVPEADDYNGRPGAIDPYLSSYKAWATGGKQLYTYTGCEQGGCDPDAASFGDSNPYHSNSQFTAIPGFGIDQPTSEVLAIGWLGYYHGIAGQLYWSATKGYMSSWSVCSNASDTTTCGPPTGTGTSWMNPGGGGKGLNGDGNLFYRYTGQNADGSTSTFPIDSIRLKRFRDGQQDNDLLKIVADSSAPNAAAANELVQCLFGAGGSCTSSPRVDGTPMFNNSDRPAVQVAAARSAMYALVESAYPTPTTTTTAPSVSSTTSTTVVAPTTYKRQDLDCSGSADMLGVASDGRLLFYPRQGGTWSPSAPIQVGSGFSGAYAKLLLPGDVNGDHKPDLIGVNSNGTLVYMPGNCTGAFGAPVTIAGVTVTSATAVGDFSGDGKPDVVDVHANGTMWMLRSNGSGGFSAATQIGDGWSSITPIGIGDPTGDGHADIGGWTSDGLILLYPGDGSGGWTPDAGYATGGAFAHATTQQVFGSTLLDNGYFDVDAITTSGSLVALAGSAIPGYDTSTTTLGSGWTNPIVQIAT